VRKVAKSSWITAQPTERLGPAMRRMGPHRRMWPDGRSAAGTGRHGSDPSASTQYGWVISGDHASLSLLVTTNRTLMSACGPRPQVPRLGWRHRSRDFTASSHTEWQSSPAEPPSWATLVRTQLGRVIIVCFAGVTPGVDRDCFSGYGVLPGW
jgi:hypothetical protein